MVCLLLAVFSALGYFNMKAIFISWFCALLKGLLGYGFLLVPPALLLTAYILAFHRGRPVQLRVTCALLLPLIFACLFHGMLIEPMAWSGALWGELMESGKALHSGGALGGILAQSFVSLFTALGATIVFVIAGVFAGLAAFDRSIVDVADWVFNRPAYDYEPEPAPRRDRRQERGKRYEEPLPARTGKRASFDIPMEDGPPAGQEPAPPKKKGFFNKNPRVPSPDQLLQSGAETVEEVPEETPEPKVLEVEFPSISKPEPITHPGAEQECPVPEPAAPVAEKPAYPAPPAPPKPVSSVPPEPPAPVSPPPAAAVPTPNALLSKVTAQEAASEAAQLGAEIEQAMGQSPLPYQYPPLSLLSENGGEIGGEALGELNANRQRLGDTIHSFGIDANIINVVRGPSVTRYELALEQGVKLNKLTNLADDIALALGATGVRIAPIPDKISVVGIEVPNKVVSPVSIREVIGSANFTGSKSKTSFAVGKDISGQAIVGDIGKLPHLLIAGTTG